MTTHKSEEEQSVVIDTKQHPLIGLMNFIGGISGLISLLGGAVVLGQVWKQVEINTHRLDVIEANGSPAFQSYVKGLAMEVEGRREADAIISKRLDDMRIDYGQRIQNITMLLEKMTEQQTQLIALIKAQNQLLNK